MYSQKYSESRLADTPEKRTSTMQTLCLVRNTISIDLHTIRTPGNVATSLFHKLKQTPNSIIAHINPHSGHFGEQFVDSLVKK